MYFNYMNTIQSYAVTHTSTVTILYGNMKLIKRYVFPQLLYISMNTSISINIICQENINYISFNSQLLHISIKCVAVFITTKQMIIKGQDVSHCRICSAKLYASPLQVKSLRKDYHILLQYTITSYIYTYMNVCVIDKATVQYACFSSRIVN